VLQYFPYKYATLTDWTGACRVVMSMPALGMGDGAPMEDFRTLAILPWSEEEMPMIRYKATGGNADLQPRIGFGENLFKRSMGDRVTKTWPSVCEDSS
jgi:hypothetical protein